MKNLFFLSLFFISNFGWTQNQIPEISNLNLSLMGESTLSMTYDLSDAENDDCFVSLHISDDDGASYQIDVSAATGDLNALIAVGNNKSITWNYAGILNSSGNYQVKLVADDQQVIDIQAIVDQVDESNLFNDLSFVEGVRHQTAGLDHLLEVRDFMADRFNSLGLNIEVTEFDYQGFTAKNYIGEVEGTDSDGEVYILCGHYDTVDNSPGADDNGTAVVGVLEAARILSQYNFKKTIKFITFDLEEPGLVGSIDYVSENIEDYETIKGVLNFEMIGYFTEEPNSQTLPTGFDILFPTVYSEVESQDFKGNFILNVGKVEQDDWELAFSDAADAYVPDLRVINLVAPASWLTLTPDLGRSDHAPFWIAGDPAVMLTGTANFRNPNYHTPGDIVETINFDFMSNVVKASIATLAEEAEVQHSDWITSSIPIDITDAKSVFSNEILIFPNPSQQLLHINAEAGKIESIQIFDVSGKMALDINNPTTNIDISVLRSGVYEVLIHGQKKSYINKLVVVD